MNVTLSPDQINQFIKARQDLHLSKTALSYQAKISLRTINDLESGHRTSFSEATLLSLCRVLEIDYAKLLEGESTEESTFSIEEKSRGPEEINSVLSELLYRTIHRVSGRTSGFSVGIILGIFLLTTIVVSIAVITNKQMAEPNSDGGYQRPDYVNPYWKNLWTIEGRDAKASERKQKIINYLDMKNVVTPGEPIQATLKWSYFTGPGTPEIFISAYTEWDPDIEIPLFHGDLHGQGSDILKFSFIAPTEPGQHRLRIFNSSSHGPVISFYGSPPPPDEFRPSSSPYVEIILEVIPDK